MQLPGIGAVWAPVWRLRERASGRLRLGQTLLFVSRGLSSGLPARINCRPQVALLELAPGDLEGLPVTHRVPQLAEPQECEA
jgi:predicted MPP superfamily phosphohydrolase